MYLNKVYVLLAHVNLYSIRTAGYTSFNIPFIDAPEEKSLQKLPPFSLLQVTSKRRRV